MAKKNSRQSEKSDVYLYDTRTNTVMAKPNQDGIKEKVSAVREVIGSSYSGHQIFLVLQFYEYSVEQAIQAFLEDGAKEALEEWHYHGNKPNTKKKKNKNKAKVNGTAPVAATTTDTKITTTVLTTSTGINGSSDTSLDGATCSSIPELLSASEAADMVDGDLIINGHISAKETAMVTASLMSPPIPIIKEPVAMEASIPPLISQQTNHNTSTEQEIPVEIDLMHLSAPTKRVKRPTTLNTETRRERTVSEQSMSSIASSCTSESRRSGAHPGLEKSVRDLQRQNSSLARHKLILTEEVEKSFKQMRKVFEEIRNALNDREADLMFEMEKVKQAAIGIFSKRIQQSSRLKQNTDRAPSMSMDELADLRADIKTFVSDRKIDEELSCTTRFTCDMEHMMEEVQKFGHVAPIRCAYNQRRPSASSVGSSVVSHDDVMTPTTPSTPSLSASFNSTTPMSPLAQSPKPDRTAKEATIEHRKSLEESRNHSTNVIRSSASSRVSPSRQTQGNRPRSHLTQSHNPQSGNRGPKSAPPGGQGHSGQGDGDKSAPKTRNARRRQRERERKQQIRGSGQAGGDAKEMKDAVSTATSPAKSSPDASVSSPAKSPSISTQDGTVTSSHPTPDRSFTSSPAKQANDVKAKSQQGGQQNRGGRPSDPNKRPYNRGSPRKNNTPPKDRSQDTPKPSGEHRTSSPNKSAPLRQTENKIVENDRHVTPKVAMETNPKSDSPENGSAAKVVTPREPNGPLVNGSINVKKANVSVENPVLEATALPQRQARGNRGSRRDVKRAEVIVNGNHGNQDEMHSIR